MSREITHIPARDIVHLLQSWRLLKRWLELYPTAIQHVVESQVGYPSLGAEYTGLLMHVFNGLDQLEESYFGDIQGVGQAGQGGFSDGR